MKVWTRLSESDLYDIAEHVGVAIADRGSVNSRNHSINKVGRAFSFGLRPDVSLGRSEGDYKYQRTSASGFNADRRVFAVCWHGHRDFMIELFKRDPDARLKTMWADYKGRDSFEDNFEATGYKNVGSMMYPMQAREVCNCWKEAW